MLCALTFSFLVSFQWKKAEEKLERELLEAEASESTEKKLKVVGSFTFSDAFKMFCEMVLTRDYSCNLGWSDLSLSPKAFM